jgi:stage II sporulation protein P
MPENSNQNPHSDYNWFIYACLGICLMTIGILMVLLTHSDKESLIASTAPEFRNRAIRIAQVRLDTQTSRFLLKSGFPILEYISGEDDPFTLTNLNWPELYWKLAANIKNANPQEILKTQLPFLALVSPQKLPLNPEIVGMRTLQNKIQIQPEVTPPATTPVEGTAEAEFQPEETQPASIPTLGDQPVVLIFHTHTSESYIPVGGKEHIYPKGDIVRIGVYLKEILEQKYGIRCLHSETVLDEIPFRLSYNRSRVALQKLLHENPGIKVVFDIHRDATPGVKAKTVINGKDTATIGIVVGSDKMGLEHPHWRKNQQFAKELEEAMNLYYPGLCSRILVSEARYNQDLHERALILEFGDQNSTLEEVNQAAELFAGILALTIKEEVEKNKG